MNTKAAFVAIVGRPNTGKSSLLNAFVGERVAIVSSKPQTTRTRITGIVTQDEIQLVFIDTPGIHQPRTKLGGFMVKQVNEGITDVDVALMLIEPLGRLTETEQQLMESLRSRRIPTILVVNKIDTLARKEDMMPKIQAFSNEFNFEQVVPISVLQGDGVPLLLEQVRGYAVEGPHYFDSDAYTDQPERVLVAEMIREKLLENLRDELPHGIAVGIEQMKERPEGNLIDISAVIYCERASHKGMIIGKQGAMLKRIGSQSRSEIERFLDIKVNLQCWVKVKEDWRNREGLMQEFGFR